MGGHPAGGATVTCLRTPASSDASGALGCCCFGTPPGPTALSLSPEGECGEATASTLPPNPRFYTSFFLTCLHERSVAPDSGGVRVVVGV